ncbi:MAG: hypothetical protein PHD95_02795 [Candidatus ainarchaeum sp.]|nr:hypothetical protein [Candidatus ainarchaeum sp.]
MGFFDFSWLFGFFEFLPRLIFPKEQFRQMPRSGIGSGLRSAIGHSRSALAQRGWKRQTRMPVGSNPKLPGSSVQPGQARMPAMRRFRQAMPSVTSRPQSGFFQRSQPGHRLRRRI